MYKCSICGGLFDEEEAEDKFISEVSNRCYGNFLKPVCGECAIDVFQSEIEGYYEEECECCGKRFDPITENVEFVTRISGIALDDVSPVLCCTCAMDTLDSQEDV